MSGPPSSLCPVLASIFSQARRVPDRGCSLGAAAPDDDRIEQWKDVPNVSDGLPEARAAIRAHITRLLDGWSAS